MADSLAPKIVRTAVLAAMLAGIPAGAQTRPPQGERQEAGSAKLNRTVSISGTVLDPSGAVVLGASVRILGQHGDIQQSIQSDSAGEFRFRGLSEGRYEVHVEQTGFKPYEARLRLRGGSERQLRIVL